MSVSVNVVQQLNAQPTFYFQQGSGFYVRSFIDIDYQQNMHTLQMPVASSNSMLASFAVVAKSTVKKIVTYTVERTGSQPALPQSVSTDSNEVLLSSDIQPAVLDVEADGVSQNWTVSGKYVYGIVDPSKVKLYAGVQPYLNVPFTSTEFTNFIPGLTCPGSGSKLTGYTGML